MSQDIFAAQTITRDICLANVKEIVRYSFADWNGPHYTMVNPGQKIPDGWIKIATVTFQQPLIDREFCIPKAVEAIDAEIKRTLADAGKAVMELEKEKAKILSIEYSGGTKADKELDDTIEDAVVRAVRGISNTFNDFNDDIPL